MKEGKSVVIDNTNPSKATRKEYIDLAKKHSKLFMFRITNLFEKVILLDVSISIFPKILPSIWMTWEVIIFIESMNQNMLAKQLFILSIRIWNPQQSNFFEWKMSNLLKVAEGFKEVEKVNFVAGPFQNKNDEEMFFCYVSSKK